eukprot:UC1_evm1s187
MSASRATPPFVRLDDEPWQHVHGRLGDSTWARPVRVAECGKEARPGYNSCKAHEYEDDPEVLTAKVHRLAELIRKSRHCTAYTGAGLSTSAGIKDYATKVSPPTITLKEQLLRKKKEKLKLKNGGDLFSVSPSIGHRALVALYHAGHLKHWVQQNHDGLPQKAGMPQEAINEIHGAWYDPSNPVVPMNGSLRDDLCEWLQQEVEATDLCLALGTSLCGMNADQMVASPAKRYPERALGAVIVSIQQTAYDDVASLRIFARLDNVLALLLNALKLEIPPLPQSLVSSAILPD